MFLRRSVAMGRDIDGGGSSGEGQQSSPRTCSQVGSAVNIIVLLSSVVARDHECFATFLADLDHCDNDGVLDHGSHVDQEDPRLARVKEELGDQEGAEDLRAEAVQSSQAGESLGSSRRI